MKKISKQIHNLIQARIDGSITPEQDARLNEILEGSESASTAYFHLLGLEEQLAAGQANDSEIDVSDKVMQKIRAKQKSPVSFIDRWFSFDSLFNAIPVARFAMIMVTGILLGSAVTWMIVGQKEVTTQSQLSGSLSASNSQGMTYNMQNTMVKVIPYTIGDLNYLNFQTDTQNELQVQVTYDEADFILRKSEYIVADGRKADDFNTGTINFKASGRTSYQIILEKVKNQKSSVEVQINQNQAVLALKQLSFE